MVRHGRRGALGSRLAGVGARRREAPHAQPAHCPATAAVTQFGGRFATIGALRQLVCEEGEQQTPGGSYALQAFSLCLRLINRTGRSAKSREGLRNQENQWQVAKSIVKVATGTQPRCCNASPERLAGELNYHIDQSEHCRNGYYANQPLNLCQSGFRHILLRS